MNVYELEEALTKRQEEEVKPFYSLKEQHMCIPEIHKVINKHNRRLSHVENQESLYRALMKLKNENKIQVFLVDYISRFIQITYLNNEVGTYTIYDG